MKEKLKVLHIEERFHPDFGYQINFFCKFKGDDIDLIILTSESLSIWNQTYNEDIRKKDRLFEQNYNVRIIREKVYLDRKNKRNIWIRGLTPEIKRINPDIIYTHGIESITAFRIFVNPFLIKRYKLATDTHMLYNQLPDGWKTSILIKAIRFFISSRINKLSVPVFYTVEENQRISIDRYGIKSKNLYSCPIGTDNSIYYYDASARIQFRERYNIATDDVCIIYTGKFNTSKDPGMILKALQQIEHSINDTLKLIFIGDGPEDYINKALKYKFDNRNISVSIIPTVSFKELYKYYSMADFAVFPKENTLSSLDAQACKLPIIMEEDMTNMERLKCGGIFYQPGNISDLASKIGILINDKHLRKRLSEDGYRYIINNFSYERIITEMEEIIKRYKMDRLL